MGSSASDQILTEGTQVRIEFGKLRNMFVKFHGGDAIKETMVIPVAVQHAETKEILIIAYVNETALMRTLTERIAVFWSTSRNELWVKGATSGDILDIVGVHVNCEQNSLIYQVLPRGTGACHTKDESGQMRESCFYREIVMVDSQPMLVSAK